MPAQPVWVTDARRVYDGHGNLQWDRHDYDLTFDISDGTLLDAIRDYTHSLGQEHGVPRSIALANGAVVTRWAQRDGLTDHRAVRFQPRDPQRGIRIGGCSIHPADRCIQEDTFPAEYDTFERWSLQGTHVEIGAVQLLLPHADCDWNSPSPCARQDYIDAFRDGTEPVPGRRCCDRSDSLSHEEAGRIILAAQVLLEYLPRQGGSLGALDILLGWRAHGLWTEWCDWLGWQTLEPLDPTVRYAWATQLALESLD